MDGRSDSGPARLVCHCLLIETDTGLVLVDTGFGLRDADAPTERLSRMFMTMLRPRLDPEETAARQTMRRGFSLSDVRHIVLTHLDFDHAGGLEDFPGARVHTMAAEHEAATHRDTMIARRRYRPQQWDEGIHWQLYSSGDGEHWFGFEAVRDLDGLPPEILMVPLHGHTRGHCGVAVREGNGWLLLAGDAYFHCNEMLEQPECPPGLRAYQRLMEVDRDARLANQDRLRRLANEQRGTVRVISSHDLEELQQCQMRDAASAGPPFVPRTDNPGRPGVHPASR